VGAPFGSGSPCPIPTRAGTQTAVSAIFLDAGGVFTLPPVERVVHWFDEVGLASDPARLHRAHYEAMAAFDQAGGDEVDLSATYVGALALGMGMPPERLGALLPDLMEALAGQGWTVIIPEAVVALRELATRGRPLAIVSNSDGTVEERLRARGVCQVGPGPGTQVAIVVDSGVLGVAKPDPRIFEPALRATGVEPLEAIHVGDSLRADVAGARAAGIRPVHLDPYGLCGQPDHDHVASLAEVLSLIG
jgi:putative hydrolase of the HAD superfamily